jgi:hypothetical protein
MEIAKKRTYIFAGVLLAFGLAAAIQPKTKAPVRSELWMEQNLPMAVGNYHMLPSAENPMCSYRVNEATYQALNPYGIVARVFANDDYRFDTMVVAANDRISLHDPKDCFPGQDWTILWEKKIDLPTKSRGPVHAVALGLQNERGKRIALYTYRGPSGTFAVRNDMFWDWFVTEVKGSKPEGALMRVMTVDEETTIDELKTFASAWFDSTYQTSGKVF